jgi:methyltransferase
MNVPPALIFALAIFLVAYATQRLLELRLSARHARLLLARGGVEYGRSHFSLFVAIHTLMPVALTLEVVRMGARPPHAWPLWLGVCVAAAALRAWSMRALGNRWTARVIVVPGEAPVATGPYRRFAHPSYLAATLEMAAMPLLFGALRTACILSALNALALAIRIPLERRALLSARALSAR